ncbi:MAG: ATP-binding protein [Gammaproteobacteria bacterium]|jgi:PAS domain S-box-containing protein|nr:ATP-binding protein [Gammaproteobacteria bacterium]
MKKSSLEHDTIVSKHVKGFFAALVLVSLAAGLRIWPLQMLESELTWLTFYPAVIAVALYAGLYAGLQATVFACLTVTLLWPLFATHPFIENRLDFLEMAIFVITCSLISYLVESAHRAQKALKQAESVSKASIERDQFTRAIIDYMPNMIGYWDRDLRCCIANSAYSVWFGKNPEDIIGLTFRELTGEQLFTLNEPHILNVLDGEPQCFERTLNKVNGSVGHIIGHYIPDFDDDGTVKGFAIHASEVTVLKETEVKLKLITQELLHHKENLEELVETRTTDIKAALDAAEKASQAKSKFLSSMSHELRTPLNAVVGFSELIEMNAKDKFTKESSQKIISASKHLLELINETLDFSKIKSGSLELNIDSYSLKNILLDCVSMTKVSAAKMSIQMDNKADSLPDVEINVDKTRFKQVILNLLSNAIKYNREHGSMVIDYSIEDKKMLCLSIADTGKGIAPDHQHEIFTSFNRAGAECSNISGTGLGLAISKKLIEKMNGRIGFKTTVGEGSCFWIEVPLS